MNDNRIYNKISYTNKNIIFYIILIGLVLGRYTELIFTGTTFILLFFKLKKIPNFFFNILILLGIIFLWSFITIVNNNYEFTKFFQQFLLISILALAYSYIFSVVKISFQIFFLKYVDIMFLVSCLGIIQFVFYLFFKFDLFMYNFEGIKAEFNSGNLIRLSSILNEPGYVGSSLTPVVAFIFFDKNFYKQNKKKSILILLSYLLTFASISYTLLLLLILTKFILYFKKKLRIYIIITIILIVGLFSFSNLLNTSERSLEDNFYSAILIKISETLNSGNEKSVDSFEETNASTYALLVNKWVANNAPSRVFGTGLGTHEQNYKKVYNNNDYELYGLNSEDGYSLYNRIFSEFGYLGLILLLIFLIKFFNINNIVNLCVLFYLIAILIRGGHYTLYGTIMFFILYYLTSKKKSNK